MNLATFSFFLLRPSCSSICPQRISDHGFLRGLACHSLRGTPFFTLAEHGGAPASAYSRGSYLCRGFIAPVHGSASLEPSKPSAYLYSSNIPASSLRPMAISLHPELR